MGRNRKMGLDYFPFDIDTFQDIRIRKLIKYLALKLQSSLLVSVLLSKIGRAVV